MTDDAKHQRLETFLAILLGIAAILTAFAAYQASLKDGDTVKSYNEGIRSINDANAFYNQALQQVNRDEGLFLEWAKAEQVGNDDLKTFIRRQLMDPNLRAGLREYQNVEEVVTPIEAEAYQVPDQIEAERLEKITEQKFATAQTLDDSGDTYELAGVIGAVSLFFLGIAGVFRSMRMRLTAMGIGTVVLVVSGVTILGA